ncbi:hypothetical protein JGH11_02620 [Dysgonomonas sp. Marseille-P4677]|uniref:hypothetical protein n=1 Tax=Dysgonomonas sp. Marseille-P4677 TaxID=2364790 RepID=UPI001913C2F4|nr:hypothetical protein [Dysgonomonas sp. Marseille-P4677]MBK5719761.1 hypothetical protein [Dysgonomonas sp. Marseille-P4677]
MKKLSAYTIAANCTDLMDCCDGYIEVREAQKNRIRSDKAPFKYFDTRRRALWAKLISFVRTQNTFDEYEIKKLEKVDNLGSPFKAKISEIAINKNLKRGFPINPNIEIDRSRMSAIKNYLL